MKKKQPNRKLIAARKRAQLSRYAIAKRTGLAQSHLKAIEDGDIESPSFRVVQLIADAVGCAPTEIFGPNRAA